MTTAEKLARALEDVLGAFHGFDDGKSPVIDKAREALAAWRSQQAAMSTDDSVRAEFEAWLISRQRAKGIGFKLTDAEFVVRNEDGSYCAIGFDLAHDAFEAGRQQGIEQARVTSAQYQSLVDAATVVAQGASKRADRAEAALMAVEQARHSPMPDEAIGAEFNRRQRDRSDDMAFDYFDFRYGVRFAEAQHGITPTQEAAQGCGGCHLGGWCARRDCPNLRPSQEAGASDLTKD